MEVANRMIGLGWGGEARTVAAEPPPERVARTVVTGRRLARPGSCFEASLTRETPKASFG